MRKYWDKLVEWLCRIPQDKMLHRGAGRMAAAFVAIVFFFRWPILAAIVFGIGKEAWDKYRCKEQWDWMDILWTVEGGLEIQLLVWLSLLIH